MYRLHWLGTICQLQPTLCWRKDRWVIEFDTAWGTGSNVPAILVLQLMAEIGGNAMRKCRNCPQWFLPTGRQVYCTCGIRAAWRDAERRERKRPRS